MTFRLKAAIVIAFIYACAYSYFTGDGIGALIMLLLAWSVLTAVLADDDSKLW